MLRETKKIIALMCVLVLFAPLLGMMGSSETVGTQGGTLRCNTNMQLIPQAGEVGGGNVRWRLTGEAARDLRRGLVNSVGDGEGVLTEEHLTEYLQTNRMLESYLQRGDALNSYRRSNVHPVYEFMPERDIEPEDHIDYHGVKITRSSLTSNNIYDSTVGLLGSTAEDSSPIEIKFTISYHERPGTHEYELNMADHRVMTAIFDSIVIPVEEILIERNETIPSPGQREYQLDHDNIIVKDGDIQARFVVRDLGGNITVIHPGEDITPDGYVNAADLSLVPGDELMVVYGYGLSWAGTSELTHWTAVVGTHSYYKPDYDDGTLYVIRTPAGKILHYSVRYDGYDEPTATIRWKQFNLIENPQLLFVIAAVTSYMAVKLPRNEFKKYRREFHVSRRIGVKKDPMIHVPARVMSILILVFYIFPSLGFIYIGGLMLIAISVVFVVISVFLSMYMYSKKTENISDEDRKPTRKPKVAAVKKPSGMAKKKCKCGLTLVTKTGKNPLLIKCPSCGEKQRRLKPGYNYIFLEEDGDRVFSIYKDLVKDGAPGLIVTTKIPSKMRVKHSLGDVDIKWLSDHDSSEHDVLDPTRLEFDITRAISNFSKEQKGGVLLLDGLEYLIVENGFERVSKFLKKTTDTCSLSGTTYMVHLNPESISDSELSILKKEFDHTEVL